MPIMEPVEARTHRQWLLRGAKLVAALLLALMVVGWLAFRHIPSWYVPAYVPIEDEQAARDGLGAAVTALSHGMGQGSRFDFIVRQDELNRWLVARDRIWPESKRWVPDQIEDPMVVFGQGEVIVAGAWMGPGPRTVVNVRLRVEMFGGTLRAVVENVRGGSLPIPLWLIKGELTRLERDRDGRQRALLPDGTSIVEAVEGAPLPREISWSQPRGKFRIEALQVVPGALHVSLQPIERREVPQ